MKDRLLSDTTFWPEPAKTSQALTSSVLMVCLSPSRTVPLGLKALLGSLKAKVSNAFLNLILNKQQSPATLTVLRP